jgi:general secretion pathway protein C
MKRLPVLVTFVLFLALCASAAYWFLQFWRPPVRQMAAPVTMATNDVSLDAAATLFGGRPAAVGVASNFQLKGVVVAENGRESVAILSADGKPAQAVGLNTEFQPGVMVKEVHPQYVLLSDSGVVKRVTLPEPSRSTQNEIVPGALSPLPQQPALPQTRSSAPPPGMPQIQTVPQMQNQVVPPVIGQMSTQLSQPVPAPLTGQMPPPMPSQALPTGMQEAGPAVVPPPSPAIGTPPAGYSQQRR